MKRWTIERSNAADADAEEIWLTIAQYDPDAADQLLDAIANAIFRLADHPLIGRSRDDIAPGLRGRVQGNYLVLYTLDAARECVMIKRILHGRRDLAAAFLAPED